VAEIDILIPTLGRAHFLPGLIANIEETTPLPHEVIFAVDSGDEATWGARFEGYLALEANGTYPMKTNAAYLAGRSPLVLPTADDVVFHPGWLEAALNALSDPSVQVVGTRDLSPITADGSHVTMPILRRSYVEDPGAAWGETGTVFHEGYHHNYVETETWQLARQRGVARFAPESVIEHRHPDWGTRERDETDARGNAANKQTDLELFEGRRARWAI